MVLATWHELHKAEVDYAIPNLLSTSESVLRVPP
jgi:hypothetical protein